MSQPDAFARLSELLDGEDLSQTPSEFLLQRRDAFRSEIMVFKTMIDQLRADMANMDSIINENTDKLKVNRSLPFLVGNVGEILDLDLEEEEEAEGEAVDITSQKSKTVIVKTSTRQNVFLPMPGFVSVSRISPGDLVALNRDSYLILDTLPPEYDHRIKAMEVDEKPTESFADIGGLDKQLEELMEAVVLPMEHGDKFIKIGIQPPKGVLLYGAPGTGKTLMAKATAAHVNATFLKIAAPQLVQMYIGDGARMIRDAFALAKEKKPAVIFIDELDAIGQKRSGGDKGGDKEVQRTMLELLNQLDGFTANEDVKVIAATNRVDILDPALLRSGRLDRKIELPLPDLESRIRILNIHSRKMNVSSKVSYRELF
ncbi:hypothetical protein GEMRC1_002025 [Eukaryota sp. GEM-RC1]